MSILRADSIRDRAGTGAPDFPNGLTGTLTGNVTGTASTATLANTATVATNAQGLTGTPNITVGTVGCGNVTSTGDVTGVNATFSGNLTVQGTTTTIDTAVTDVDSLQIDGSLKVGTTQDSSFPDRLVSVGSTTRASSYLDIRSTTTAALLFADGLSGDAAYRGQVEYRHNDDSMRLWTAAGERLRIESGGFVGLGTDNPYHELHIQGSGDTRALITSGGTGDAVMMFENASGNTWGHGIDLTNNNYVIAYNGTSDPSLTTDGMFEITGIGSVGVGLANPDSRFHVQSTSNHVATFEYSSTSDMAIQLKNSQGSMWFGLGGGEEFAIATDADLNGNDMRFSVDQNGAVRTPDQPTALVYKTGTTQNFTSDGLVSYDATSYSQGGMTINASRNRITVPVAGKYMVNASTSGSVTTVSAGDGWKLQILKNGAVYNHTYGYPIETTGSTSGQELAYTVSMVVDCSVNDYIEIKIENIGAAAAGMSYGYFGVYLLG